VDSCQGRGADPLPVRLSVDPARGVVSAAPTGLVAARAHAPGGGAGRTGCCPVADGAVVTGKRSAQLLGAWIVFEDEAGQDLKPGKGRTWSRRAGLRWSR
jgi:hypothetical protein